MPELSLVFLAAAAATAYIAVDYRRRRLAYSSWRRLVRWEFWPMEAFYPPVVLYILYLGIRYRSFTLFTAANPAMPHGGIALMSKSAILKGLMDKPEHVATFTVLDADLSAAEKCSAMDAFMKANGFDFPIVIKPDYGERGKGVAISLSRGDAMEYFEDTAEKLIVQEYVPGVEFGVFYVRHPDNEKGTITSLTSKLPTHVVGDGIRTLERLILDDPRAVCMARFFLDKFEDQLDAIVPKDERFILASLGTHSRGSLFLDASDVWTPALEDAIDRLSQGYKGFHIGRYDIRVDSVDSLKRGLNFKAVELNGVVSEPTHMYDPKHGLAYAYATMFALWKNIFEVAAANRARGKPASTIKELREMLRKFSG